jgi:hypothetical protein
MKLTFSRNPFVQFTGMFDVIFKFTVPFRQLRGHHVNSMRRIVPAGWTISDRLAEVELMGHVARPEAYDPFKDCPDDDTLRLAGTCQYADRGDRSRFPFGIQHAVHPAEEACWKLE